MEVINLFIEEIIKAYLRLQIVQAKGFPLEGLKRLNQPIKRYDRYIKSYSGGNANEQI